MAYLTIHRLDGDSAELLRRKQERFDPTIKALAGEHGALFSVTATTARGLVVVNVWESPKAAAEFARLPPVQQAQKESGLPMPSSFERYPEAQVDGYRR
jgi:hypothetical protein